jgi:hypothetical protein
MPTPRAFSGAVHWNGKIYVAGGRNGGDGMTTVEIFDLATSTWSAGPPLNFGRTGLGLAVASGKIHAVAGMTRASSPSNLVNFPPGNPAPIEVLDTGVVRLPWNGAIYLFGGAWSDGTQGLSGEMYFPTP